MVSKALAGLVRRKDDDAEDMHYRPLTIMNTGACAAVLQSMQSKSLVDFVEEDVFSRTYRFSQAAAGKLRCLRSWQCQGPALEARPDISVLDATVFELLSMLSSDGWSFMVKPVKGRRHASRKKPGPEAVGAVAAVGLAYPTDYYVGAPKQVWATVKQKSHSAWYLRALLLAHEHKKIVPHFKTSSFYEHLVTGKVGSGKRRKNKSRSSISTGNLVVGLIVAVAGPGLVAMQAGWSHLSERSHRHRRKQRHRREHLHRRKQRHRQKSRPR